MRGRLFGYFLIGLFSIRFIVEFVKESQGGIETFLPGLSTGQWLSIPFILIGIIFLFISKKKAWLTNFLFIRIEHNWSSYKYRRVSTNHYSYNKSEHKSSNGFSTKNKNSY